MQHDYTRKQGLAWEHVFLPEHAPPQWHDREALWNAVEAAEKTKDSRLAREFVVALPTELELSDWKRRLTDFIQDQLVGAGMCVDAAIHDTDGHNPHAHILMTVRPLTDKGGWQNKTEKEYLCIKNGEERGFTATEYNTAKHDGWEKQYKYKVENKKQYLPPTEAERLGYERADKHPKSTRYGRQNPVTARWNSEEQLIAWREAWADSVNKALESRGIEDRIDHRSFAAIGITEQPTIHEGYIARNLERRGVISDRCEINRQIRSDNQLLREIRKQVRALAKKAAETIPAIAEALESIRGNIVRLCYHLFHNSSQRQSCIKRINAAEPIIRDYKNVKSVLKDKQAEKRELLQEKQQTGLLKPVRHFQLNQQLSGLTEEIEELKFRKSQLMTKLYCQTDADVRSYEARIKQWTEALSKLERQHETLNSQIEEQTNKFHDLVQSIPSDKVIDLLDARIFCRRRIANKVTAQLKETFGDQFSQNRLEQASDYADNRLGEDPNQFWSRRLHLTREEANQRRKEHHPRKWSVRELER